MTIESYRSARHVEIPEGSSGTVIEFTMTNNGAAIDISAATNIRFNTETMDQVSVDSNVSCSFTTDGTDGKIDVPVSAATVASVRDLIADVRYDIATETIRSYPFVVRIIPGAN